MPNGLVRGYTRHLVSPSPGQGRTDPLDPGLAGEWRFDPATGLVLPDYSGRGKTGVVTGCTWIGTSYGSGLDFDGAGNYVQLPAAYLKGRTEFSVELLFKLDSVAAHQHIFWEGDGNGNGWGAEHEFHITFDFGVGMAQGLGMWMVDAGLHDPSHIICEVAFTDTGWNHVVGTVSGAIDGVLYLNGGLVDSDSGDNAISTANYNTNTRIGRPGAADRYFNGQMALVRIYNRVLTAGEVQKRYQLCLQRQQRTAFGWMLPQGKAPAVRVPRHPAVVYQTPAIY